MTLLDTHLEQISLSAAALSDLPFPPPKIFTNALLQPHDITALIRDTEAHERALFSLARPPDVGSDHHVGRNKAGKSRATLGPGMAQGFTSQPIRTHRGQTAVAAVLGGDMVQRINRAETAGARDGLGQNRERGELDVEILLKGAERLCAVPISGAVDKISTLRNRHARLKTSIDRQESMLAQISAGTQEDDRHEMFNDAPVDDVVEISEEDLKQVEEEIRSLERKKRELEDRVNGMERDLGGLLR
ncbi:MAG: 26S proteasome non-ATPase regulatory subunit [Watsoniomyces obsoletus]|nr:MAG: 26S proteasome non-ATPase regulatory subunit [Watsoniomyces obsoletus]